ncbi:3-hydroxyacyl-CoA dehydrogenase family protein [Ferviditalea candida]|uniref:3-hydroxyacyl-CoA dehydrogenase family protein n=1 Tax=Ferviditalea candida TaxID=3108399 RepID=A0ABU5ZPX8_9BACL|nr:3-hydroxyacyl-CoA dehydrogenase family protein [Paenibacillaceae bacterium T2]
MDMKTIGVVGAGTMGGGIAHLAASSGLDVILYDLNDQLLDAARNRMSKLMDNRISKGKMSEADKAEVLSRIQFTTDLGRMGAVDFAIEVVIEDMNVKKQIFKQLDEILRPGVILATNTSSMSITELAQATGRQSQVAGMHFFNPPQVMKLVEVVRGYQTSDETVAQIRQLCSVLGKEPVEVKKDSPGFIVNRIMVAQFVEAIRLVEEGVASPEDIDKAVTLGLNYPMGPFTLQDFAGVDIGLYVMDYLYNEYKDSRFAAPMAIRRIVRAGRLGKKTGAGWYDYE